MQPDLRMFARSDLFLTLQLVLLLGFIGVTSMLMLVTVTNRMRLRRVVHSWRTGRLFGLPLWPAAFLLVVLLFSLYAAAAEHVLHAMTLAGYLVGGVFWTVAALLSSTVNVTEYGLILNVNRVDQAVAWGQVVDYFELAQEKGRTYVFFYLDGSGVRRRLELTVPDALGDAFRELVAAKLDARFEFSAQQLYGNKALEG